MIVLIALNLIILLIFLHVPDRVLDRVHSSYSEFVLKFRAGDAQRLLLYLSRESRGEVPQYKYFSEILITLLEFKRNFGLGISKTKSDLKKALVKDSQFERKISSQVKGAFSQSIMVGIIVWGFAYMAGVFVERSPPTFIFIIMGFLQVSGAIILYLSLKYLRMKKFKNLNLYFYSLYSLKCFASSGCSTAQVISMSRVESLKEIKEKDLELLRSRVIELVTLWKLSGRPIKDEIDELIDELHFILELRFESFLKQLIGLKFLVLSVFFLSSYLIYILGLFTMFLEMAPSVNY